MTEGRRQGRGVYSDMRLVWQLSLGYFVPLGLAQTQMCWSLGEVFMWVLGSPLPSPWLLLWVGNAFSAGCWDCLPYICVSPHPPTHKHTPFLWGLLWPGWASCMGSMLQPRLWILPAPTGSGLRTPVPLSCQPYECTSYPQALQGSPPFIYLLFILEFIGRHPI